MTTGAVLPDNGPISHAERACCRHEQLFDRAPRIAPLDRELFADQIVAATTKLSNTISGKEGPPVPLAYCPDMIATLVRHPDLWDRFSMLSAQLLSVAASLPARSRQLAIMRTVWLCGAPYQWGEHIARTKAAGISDQEMEQIKDGSRVAGWNALDRAILAAAEEFRADSFVSEQTWTTLAQHLDENQLFELLVLIGQFASVAFVLNSLRIRLEKNNPGFLPAQQGGW